MGTPAFQLVPLEEVELREYKTQVTRRYGDAMARAGIWSRSGAHAKAQRLIRTLFSPSATSQQHVYGIRSDSRLIGYVWYSVEPDEGVSFNELFVFPGARGRRFGSTVTRALCEEWRISGVTQITGTVMADNTRMLRLVEEAGFVEAAKVFVWRGDPA